MRSPLALALLGVLGCATTQSTSSCPEVSSVAALPRWMTPAPTVDPAASASPDSRTLFVDSVASRGTIRIAAEVAPDPLAQAMGARGRRRVRSMSLREAPVADTLRMFAEMGGFNVVFSEDVPARTITLTLRDVSVLGAFRTVLSAAQLGADAVDPAIVSVRPRAALATR